MRPFFVLRQILMDDFTLGDYYQGKRVVEWKVIQQRMISNERKINPQIPDHFYNTAVENQLKKEGIVSLRTLIEKGFFLLAKEHLELGDKTVYVQKEAYAEWQNLITFCPPLVLSAALIAHVQDYDIYTDEYIRSNAHCSALVVPNIPCLKNIRDREGFDDLHFHVNAIMESDNIWIEALKDPYGLCKICESDVNSYQSYIEQEKLNYGLRDIYLLLTQARALRYYIIRKYLFKSDYSKLQYPNLDFQIENYDVFSGIEQHPMGERVRGDYSDLELEMLFYINIFIKLNKEKETVKEDLVKAFYHYLLIHSYINRFFVQQINQKGFLQFQKVAHLNMGRKAIKGYLKSFSQLGGNQLTVSNFRILELRFSLGKTVKDTVKFIDAINEGWSRKVHALPAQKLRLVVHFLKLSMNDSLLSRRGEALRTKIWEQGIKIGKVIRILKQRNENGINITGIDAAGSEFNAPPEVFGPIYRKLRREGIEHFTYHVGEDFYHILSGLRHIYETVDFLGLQQGDRLGHAVALGIDPELWKARVGEYVCMSQGEWLDNLIFVCYLEHEITKNIHLSVKGSLLCNKILEYSKEIYGGVYTLKELIAAWKARQWEPNLFLSKDYSEAQTYNFDFDEWRSIQAIKVTPRVKNLVNLYHNHECKERYDKKCIYLDHCEKIMGTKEIKALQKIILQIIIQQGIVIEVLPTSNLRIGIYNSYKDLHIKRWLLKYPDLQLVVGSDDPGVFATNIYNEYAHIYTILQEETDEESCCAMIQRLHDNSLKYAF